MTDLTYPRVNAVPAKAIPAVRGIQASARRPYHIGVAMGLCAGLYAGSLAAVTVLQINQDRSLIEDRAPVSEAIALLGQHNDQTATAIDAASGAFQKAADGYDGLNRGAASLDAAVKKLTARVAAIKGGATGLSNALLLPSVGGTVRSYTGGGSSGGSSSGGTKVGGGSSGGGGSSTPIAIPRPRPVPPPPPVHGGTGPSGGG